MKRNYELLTLAKLYDKGGKSAMCIVRTLYAYGIRTYDDLRNTELSPDFFPKHYFLAIGEKRYEIMLKMQKAIRA